MRVAVALLALLLAGCATPETKSPPRKAVVKAQSVKPEPKALTFRERWLSRFFRERAQ